MNENVHTKAHLFRNAVLQRKRLVIGATLILLANKLELAHII